MMLDSGAFSAWRLGIPITAEEYTNFLLDNIENVDTAVALDVIPGSYGRPATKQEKADGITQSFKNYEYMRKRLGGTGIDAIPVYHQHEPLDVLVRILEEGYTYIGLSPANDQRTAERKKWLQKVFHLLCDEEGRPYVKTHGFGVTAPPLVYGFPWYTCDSASWFQAGAFGGSIMPPLRPERSFAQVHDLGNYENGTLNVYKTSVESPSRLGGATRIGLTTTKDDWKKLAESETVDILTREMFEDTRRSRKGHISQFDVLVPSSTFLDLMQTYVEEVHGLEFHSLYTSYIARTTVSLLTMRLTELATPARHLDRSEPGYQSVFGFFDEAVSSKDIERIQRICKRLKAMEYKTRLIWALNLSHVYSRMLNAQGLVWRLVSYALLKKAQPHWLKHYMKHHLQYSIHEKDPTRNNRTILRCTEDNSAALLKLPSWRLPMSTICQRSHGSGSTARQSRRSTISSVPLLSARSRSKALSKVKNSLTP